jgi:nucleotide-binding universal stress UspA family protein
MYDTILVPTDGSVRAEAAVQHALNLATTFGSRVHFLSIVDERAYSTTVADVDPVARGQRERSERHATEGVRALATRATKRGVPYQTVVEHGVPHETILSYVDEHDVDLIAMGTHGRTGLDHLLLGSVTERLVRTSDVPVLTVRLEPDDVSYDRILIPTDGSEAAATAIEHGITVAERYDATVHALSVVDLDSLPGGYGDRSVLPDARRSLEQRAERAVETVAERCERHGLEVVTAIQQGTPSRVIHDYVDETEIDLVTMSTHGRTGLERYLVGSTTERVVRTSDAPVLTVPSSGTR